MSEFTTIEFSDSSSNATMGCDVPCELRPSPEQARESAQRFFRDEFPRATPEEIAGPVFNVIGDHNATEIYQLRGHLVHEMCALLSDSPITESDIAAMTKRLKDRFDAIYICYAHELHLFRGKDITKPHKLGHSGHAPQFEQVTRFPGRIAEAACWSDLFGTVREDKPWLDYLPRCIFISDMGDSLSETVDFHYLKTEIIDGVDSKRGRQHLWQWITKNPKRMAEFGKWLGDQGVAWPENLIPITTVTSRKCIVRVRQLLSVPSRFKGVILEPLWEQVTLPLEGIDWCIVGGQSGAQARPFDVAWIENLQAQCAVFGTALFVKQLGAMPIWQGEPLELVDGHGGHWAEWPAEFRVRAVPAGFRSLRLDALNLAPQQPSLPA